MIPHDLPGGIPSRVSGLAAGLIRHLLSLGSLAALEGRMFIRQSIAGIILLAALLLFAMISYVALVASAISLLAMFLKWGWPLSLAAAGLLHLAFVGILYTMLRVRIAPRPFEATSAELQKDIDALSIYSSTPHR